jgi:F-type H+-transporting ATPase subunit epsilon
MHLEIITPQEQLFEGEVKLVQLPGTKGSFEILKNHAPIISTLDSGQIRFITDQDVESSYQIDGGVIEAKNNHIIVLADRVNL